MKLQENIQELLEKFNFNGAFSVRKDDVTLFTLYRGKTEVTSGKAIDQNTRLPLGSGTRLFTLITAMKLVEEKKLSLDAKVSDYFPKLKTTATVENLIRVNSGIESYISSVISMNIYNHKKDYDMSEGEFLAFRSHACQEKYSVDEIVDMIKDLPEVNAPGECISDCATEYVLLGDICERVSGRKLAEMFDEYVNKPLGIHASFAKADTTNFARFENSDELFKVGKEENANGYTGMTATADEMSKLGQAVLARKLLSKKSWKYVFTKYDKDMRCCMDVYGGWMYSFNGGCGTNIGFAINEKYKAVVVSASTTETKYIEINPEKSLFFQNCALKFISAEFGANEPLRFVKLSEKNAWTALDIEVNPEQIKFVNTPKDTICYSAADRAHKPCYVLQSGDLVVGLCALGADKKKGEYYIEIFMIDKLYQGRGFGKQGIKMAIQKLKEMGAKTINICFNQRNERARHVYESCGFKCITAWSFAIKMAYYVDEHQD